MGREKGAYVLCLCGDVDPLFKSFLGHPTLWENVLEAESRADRLCLCGGDTYNLEMGAGPDRQGDRQRFWLRGALFKQRALDSPNRQV